MKNVLFIEDDKDLRENITELLELSNYKVITAENGKIGIDKAKLYKPDIIICDIMMPQLSGYDVLETLSESKDTGNIPFIFLTAKVEKSDIRKGMNLGADDYLTKPFEENELLDAIETRLKKNAFLKKTFSKNIEGLNEFLEEATQFLDRDKLSKNYSSKSYKKKDTIFMEGSASHHLYFIQSGTAKTFRITESGKVFVTGIYTSGDFMGQLSLLNQNGIHTETAKVIKDAEIFEIPKEDFNRLLYGNKIVAKKFISIISNNLIDTQEQLMNMAFTPVRQRVAKTLLKLYHKGIQSNNKGIIVDMPREDFAGMVGTATETAIRMLTEFKEEGLITMGSGRKIILKEKEKLERISNFI